MQPPSRRSLPVVISAEQAAALKIEMQRLGQLGTVDATA
jgi:hypothetical protein